MRAGVFAISLGMVLGSALSAWAGEIVISEAYARSSGPNAKAGAAFLIIENTQATSDRLLNVGSDVAARTELHTHIMTNEGVMQMRQVEGGIEIPAGGLHSLERGGDHIMFMGLFDGFEQGDTVSVTLEFERAGRIEVTVPVDLDR